MLITTTRHESLLHPLRLYSGHALQISQEKEGELVHDMEKEIKGFQIESCFRTEDCPNRAVAHNHLAQELEQLPAQKNLKAFMQEKVRGPLRMHHQRRTIS